MTAKTLKHKKLLIVIAVILIFLLTFAATIFTIIKIGENRLKNSLIADEKISASDDFDYDADVYIDGKAYYYNDDIVNILLIGVDEYVNERETHGQADAIFLVSLNTDSKKVNIFSISRNTVTQIDLYDAMGSYYSSEEKQICLSYSYGKTDEQSSQNCAKSVSKLLYGIPINGYYTIYLDAIADIVDAVGGVSVTLAEELPTVLPNNKVGDTVRINGDIALRYLRVRGDSSAPRLERQKAFISSFIGAAKTAVSKDLSLPLKMYKKLSEKSVTDVDSASAVYMASEAVNSEFSILSLPGESGFDGTYETFEVNKEALYQLVLDSFYKEKQ